MQSLRIQWLWMKSVMCIASEWWRWKLWWENILRIYSHHFNQLLQYVKYWTPTSPTPNRFSFTRHSCCCHCGLCVLKSKSLLSPNNEMHLSMFSYSTHTIQHSFTSYFITAAQESRTHPLLKIVNILKSLVQIYFITTFNKKFVVVYQLTSDKCQCVVFIIEKIEYFET